MCIACTTVQLCLFHIVLYFFRHIFVMESFIYPTDVQLDCSKNVKIHTLSTFWTLMMGPKGFPERTVASHIPRHVTRQKNEGITIITIIITHVTRIFLHFSSFITFTTSQGDAQCFISAFCLPC